jgi:hypothetical protein
MWRSNGVGIEAQRNDLAVAEAEPATHQTRFAGLRVNSSVVRS